MVSVMVIIVPEALKTSWLAMSTLASKLPQTYSLLLAKASTSPEPSISQSFHKLRVLHWPTAFRGKLYFFRSAALSTAALNPAPNQALRRALKQPPKNAINECVSTSEACRQLRLAEVNRLPAIYTASHIYCQPYIVPLFHAQMCMD